MILLVLYLAVLVLLSAIVMLEYRRYEPRAAPDSAHNWRNKPRPAAARKAGFAGPGLTEDNLPPPVSQAQAGLMPPKLVVVLYAFIVVLLAVLVRWEYKRARNRRTNRFDPFSRDPK